MCIRDSIYAVYNGKSQETPGSAMAFLGDFCFLAGVPSRELVMFRPDGCGPYIIMAVSYTHLDVYKRQTMRLRCGLS